MKEHFKSKAFAKSSVSDRHVDIQYTAVIALCPHRHKPSPLVAINSEELHPLPSTALRSLQAFLHCSQSISSCCTTSLKKKSGKKGSHPSRHLPHTFEQSHQGQDWLLCNYVFVRMPSQSSNEMIAATDYLVSVAFCSM